jgi:hypothetical protein
MVISLHIVGTSAILEEELHVAPVAEARPVTVMIHRHKDLAVHITPCDHHHASQLHPNQYT